MKSPDSDHDEPLSKGDPLWDLLGRSPKVEPDPWLETRTLARVRREAMTSETTAGSLLWAWWTRGLAIAGLTAAVVVGGLMVMQTETLDSQAASSLAAADSTHSPSQAGDLRWLIEDRDGTQLEGFELVEFNDESGGLNLSLAEPDNADSRDSSLHDAFEYLASWEENENPFSAPML